MQNGAYSGYYLEFTSLVIWANLRFVYCPERFSKLSDLHFGYWFRLLLPTYTSIGAFRSVCCVRTVLRLLLFDLHYSQTALRNSLLHFFIASLSELHVGILWQCRGAGFTLRVFTAVHQLRSEIFIFDFVVFPLIFWSRLLLESCSSRLPLGNGHIVCSNWPLLPSGICTPLMYFRTLNTFLLFLSLFSFMLHLSLQ